MATIAKITNGASAASALNYALGKDKELHNDMVVTNMATLIKNIDM